MLTSGVGGTMVDNLREPFGRTSEYFVKRGCRMFYFCVMRGGGKVCLPEGSRRRMWKLLAMPRSSCKLQTAKPLVSVHIAGSHFPFQKVTTSWPSSFLSTGCWVYLRQTWFLLFTSLSSNSLVWKLLLISAGRKESKHPLLWSMIYIPRYAFAFDS